MYFIICAIVRFMQLHSNLTSWFSECDNYRLSCLPPQIPFCAFQHFRLSFNMLFKTIFVCFYLHTYFNTTYVTNAFYVLARVLS